MLGSLGKLGGESAYQFGPNLGVSGDSLFVAWREWDGEGDEDICCRLCCRRQVTLGPSVVARARVLDTVQALLTADGAPRLVWVTVCSGHGTVCEWQPARGVAGVPCLSGLNCGELSVAAAPDGACWLAAQVWGGPYPTIQLSRDGGGQWAGLSLGAHVGGFAVSPVLAVAPSGTVLVVWAEYVVRAWRLGGVLVRGDRAVPLAPLAVPGHDLLCPAVVCDGRGAFHLACCLERPVLLEGGDVSRHSRIVTATLDATRRAWDKDPEESCIDYAMNPWMAGYAGRRRRPSLVGDPSGGAWVFFEEKLDPDSMSPGPGRLVMRRGGESPEVVVLTGQSGYHVAPKLSADGTLAVVSRFQAQRYGGPPPTCELHAVSPAAGCPPRPAPLPDNSHASLFVAAAPADATARPACEGELRLFFGDPHLHSRLSGDLEGEQEELYLFARDTAGLDFVAFTENDYVGFTHPLAWGAWERSKRNADFFNVPGTFTALVGWEYTLHAGPGSPGLRNSHRSVLFPGADGPVYRWFGGQAPTPEELVKLLRGRSVLLHHHHASGYDITDDRLERNIEVCSGWANCMRLPGFVAALHGLLARGCRLGFIGGSDNHERNPGLGGALTGVWAEANTRDAIFAAFQARRAFATTGVRADVRFGVAGAFMGGATVADTCPVVELTVAGGVRVTRVEVIRDGQVRFSEACSSGEVAFAWEDRACPVGEHYYYAHVQFAGQAGALPWNRAPAVGVDAWSSPVWVTRD